MRSAYKLDIENNLRGLIFKAKFYPWLFIINWFKGFKDDFHPFIPGLEMKFAIEEAKKLNKPVILGGLEIDEAALYSLRVETRMDPISLFYNGCMALHNKLWRSEYIDTYSIYDVHGGEAFAESVDFFRLNWFIKLFEKYAPYQKKVLVDQKDLDLFYALYRDCPGKTIVAVVN